METKHGRGCVYSIRYHLVWCVKYRKKILDGAVASYLESVLRRTALENGIDIVEMNVGDGDHVHILIDCTPRHFIPDVLKSFKGTSARWLFRQFPELRKKLWGGSVWNPSYFAATVSDNTTQQIERYIREQNEDESGEESQDD